MGAAHSNQPRSVSMDNPTPGVIDVSDEVVQRLKRGINKQAKENAAASTPAPPPPAAPKKEVRSVPIKPAPPVAPAAPAVVQQSPPTVVYAPIGGTTLTAMDMQRQKEIELKQNDALWRQRLSQLEQTLKKTNVIMENEYSTAVDDVRNRFATASPTHQLPPCQDLKTQLIACYRAHPGETLKCAEEVAMFRSCVNMNRILKLDAEEKHPVAATSAVSKPAKAG